MSGRLLHSTAVVGSMTLVSRLLGMVRDIVVARFFGAGLGADAFFVAFKIPNFLRRLFAEGAFSQAFVPVLSEYKTRRSQAEVRELLDATTGYLGAVLFGVTLVGVIAAPVLVLIFAPGFLHDAVKFELTVKMVRITFPYLFFISLTALAGGVLNSYGRFGVPAFTPVFLNLSLIGATLWLAPRLAQPVTALAWGVFIAGVVQLAFQLPYLQRLGLLPRPRWRRGAEGVSRILRLMLPGIFGSSVAQINLLIDTLMASFLATGSVSWLYFSDRLMEFPLGVFGIALATVILPRLAQQHAEAAPAAFARTLDWALRLVIVIGVPAATGLFVLAGPMLVTLFAYGEFSLTDARMAQLSLMAYAMGLLGFILVKVLAPGFYARQNTRTPVRIGVISMIANTVLNLVFVLPMVWLGIPGPHAGLALATTLASFLNAGLLLRGLRAEIGLRLGPGWRRLLLQVFAANALMALLLWWGAGDIGPWIVLGWPARIVRLALWIALGAAAYLVSLRLAGMNWRQLRISGPE